MESPPFAPNVCFKRSTMATHATHFVTLITHQKRCVLGLQQDGLIVPNAIGRCVAQAISAWGIETPSIADLSYVVMPNHVHLLFEWSGRGTRKWSWGRRKESRATCIERLKTSTQLSVGNLRGTPHVYLWMPGFTERALVSSEDAKRAQQYLEHNPRTWSADPLFQDENLGLQAAL